MTSLSDVEILDGPGPDKVLPLTIRPKSEKSAAFLNTWLTANREWVQKKTVEHGKYQCCWQLQSMMAGVFFFVF